MGGNQSINSRVGKGEEEKVKELIGEGIPEGKKSKKKQVNVKLIKGGTKVEAWKGKKK